MATAPSAGASVNAPQTNTFNITPQPGQDSKALSDEVARRLAEKQGVQRRGAMYDHAMGYYHGPGLHSRHASNDTAGWLSIWRWPSLCRQTAGEAAKITGVATA